MVSALMSEELFDEVSQIWHTEAHGQGEEQARIKMAVYAKSSAPYLKKYLTFPHQILYAEAQ